MPSFDQTLKHTKLKLLQMHYQANCGHLGGNFSCIDALMTLHHHVITDNDRFILSKGHSAGALYATLWSLGKITDAELTTFSQDDSALPGHPSGKGIPNLMFSTGSLGHGPSLAAGLALAAKYQHTNRKVYCLCSDGEWQEGSCWEALTFAVHHKLNNLFIIIDQNGLQGFGKTEDIISCHDLRARIKTFGANVKHVNGHDCTAITQLFESESIDKPSVFILETVKGKDLYFEGTLESHYLPLNEEQYLSARRKIEGN